MFKMFKMFKKNNLISLPLIEEDFEKILENVTNCFGLPLNDDMRVMTVSYFHSLDRTVFKFSFDELGAFLYKCQSNDTTYRIGNAIHLKRQAEAKVNAELAKQTQPAIESKPSLSVVEPSSTQLKTLDSQPNASS